MKLLIDMNLSPDWVEVFEKYNIEAVHWSDIGDPRARDAVIMEWARTNGYIVFTHDLDFGSMLAVTGTETPSVMSNALRDTEALMSVAEAFKFFKELRELYFKGQYSSALTPFHHLETESHHIQ